MTENIETLQIDPTRILHLAEAIFVAAGAPQADARIVAEHLVEASQMGHESHGITRIPFYAGQIRDGEIVPGAPISIERDLASTAIVNGNFNFGQVTAARMAELAVEKCSRTGVACIVSRKCEHVGRLGAWTERIARAGFFALASCASPKMGHFVLPWGGREPRLATNPISWAAPTESEPVVLDMTTSAMAEGQIRAALNAGKPLPPGRVVDSSGNPTTDPGAFYGPPRGSILPFGGEFGYKGFGLGLLPMILGEALLGEEIQTGHPYTNALAIVAVNPDNFCDRSTFRRRVQEISDYMRATPPAAAGGGVLMPGDVERKKMQERARSGIPLPRTTWKQIQDVAAGLGIGRDAYND